MLRMLLLALLLSSSVRAAPALHSASVGYFGETLLHPGLRAGADFVLLEAGRHRLLGAGHLGGYFHAGHHTGLLADVESGYRYTFDGGFFGEARLGLDYLRTFLAGDVYERSDADGSFRTATLAGQNGLAVTQALGLGYDFSRRTGTPLSLFLRLGLFEQFPFNDGWNFHLTSQLGLSWHFGRAP